jgi:predicted enzyme related to lactoylglutathione lyase
MSHLPGKFVWFEHRSPDIAKARSFYEPLFNWHVESMPMGERTYSMILNGDTGIGGMGSIEAGTPSHWMSYISVLDVDHSFSAATRSGAKALMGPTDFGQVGRGATIADPTGAVVSLWNSANADRPDLPRAPVGDFVWNELWTADPRKALSFYEKVFGYSHQTMKTVADPGNPYYVLKSRDGKMRGGLMGTPMKGAPTVWLPYVEVADCDAAAAKAHKLGATLAVPPTDIENIGRFSVFVDPQGAALAVIKSA